MLTNRFSLVNIRVCSISIVVKIVSLLGLTTRNRVERVRDLEDETPIVCDLEDEAPFQDVRPCSIPYDKWPAP